MIRSCFAGDVSEQDDIQKGSFQRMAYGDTNQAMKPHEPLRKYFRVIYTPLHPTFI